MTTRAKIGLRSWQTSRAVLVLVATILFGMSGPSPGFAQGSGSKLMADGEKSLSEGQYDAAVDQLSKAIKSGSLGKPEMAKAFISRGQALQGKGSHARAVADFTNALWLESLSGADSARAFALRGHSRQILGQKKSAADDFKKAEAAQPGISRQVGAGTAGASTGRTPAAAAKSSSDDGGGFFSNLLGGASEEPSATTRQRSTSRGASGTVARTARPVTAPASQTTSRQDSSSGSSSGGFLSGLFGGDDEPPKPVAQPQRRVVGTQPSSGPQRLVASQPSQRTQLRATNPASSGARNNVNRPGVLSDILPGQPIPQRKPGQRRSASLSTQTPSVRTSQPSRQIIRPAVSETSDDEPGFFERIFSSDSSESAGSSSRTTSPTRGTPANRPRNIVARSDGPPARNRQVAATPASGQAQRDTRLPTFVNQPRLTDRILNPGPGEARTPGGGGTQLASLRPPSQPLRSPSRRVAAPVVNVAPAQLDWNQTTRVERGPAPTANSAGRARPVTTSPQVQPAPVVRRAPVTRQAAVQAPVAPVTRPPQTLQRPVAAATRQPSTEIRRPVPATQPSQGQSETLGSAVRSAFNWIGNGLNSVGETLTAGAPPTVRPTAPAQQRVTTAPPKPAPAPTQARTTYRPPANAVKRPAPAPTRRNASGGRYLVQVAARQKRSDAEAAARSVGNRHSAILGGAKPYIVKADIPGKGTYYRVRVGPYRSQQQVASICAQLKGRGQDCFATR